MLDDTAIVIWPLGAARLKTVESAIGVGFVAAMVVFLTLGEIPAIAYAGPDIPPNHSAGGGSCAYTLTPPRPTEVAGGASAMTATMTPGECSGQPVITTVCLSSPSGRTECANRYAFDGAQVTTVALAVGPFTATGKGCWQPGLNATLVCETRGPLVVTF